MAKFVIIEIFTDNTHISSDRAFINPDHIIGIKEIKSPYEDVPYVMFWTSDGNTFDCPISLDKFKELIS